MYLKQIISTVVSNELFLYSSAKSFSVTAFGHYASFKSCLLMIPAGETTH